MSALNPTKIALAASLVWAGLIAALPDATAASYSIGGSVVVYASPTGPETARHTNLVDRETHASDDLTVYGSSGAGNYGQARFSADLQTGKLEAYSYAATGLDAGPPRQWLGAQATSAASLFDTLSFRIPAGDYANGLVAELHGRMTGTILLPALEPEPWNVGTVVGFSSWGVEFQRQRGGDNTWDYIRQSTGFLYATTAPQTHTFDTPFTLQINLLDTKTVLSAPAVVDTWVTAYIGRAAANQVAVYAQHSASAAADFSHSLRLESVGVPDGVTWTSASTVFLIPEPASYLMLLAGLPLLLLARRRLTR